MKKYRFNMMLKFDADDQEDAELAAMQIVNAIDSEGWVEVVLHDEHPTEEQ